ncbi:MAG: ATP-dependent metallopeptidase FtsH/Yme1/Tma family protein [Alphaproteobacteria bacterium]|nr:MAG: ATP-dependent metallopeptidase FtsH/Yme1/Tma family protein [Alphaproteobacteria bacterium]
MPNFSRNIFIWVGVFFVLVLIFDAVESNVQQGGFQQASFSQFLASVERGEVREVVLKRTNEGARQVIGTYTSGTRFMTSAPEYPALVDVLKQNGVEMSAQYPEAPVGGVLGWFLSFVLPFVVVIGIYMLIMRQMQGGGRGGGAMGFGKSRARLLTEKSERKTFTDVAGVEEAKDELQEVVDFLKDPGKFQRLGGKIPKGCLLVGPPGTGKTLLARAIAGEAGVPFFTISGSDFVEMFVGVGASRVRDMFEQGKKNAPCIIFIDEIDAVGRSRGVGLGGGNDEREQTLNQLLVEMDGFESNEGVILIAATNRPDVLDPALLRPGRFDRQIVVPNPDVTGRESILNVHGKKVPLSPDVDIRVLARGTPGFSGADLANLVNEAALLAARRDKKVVTMKELEDAKDKVMMGAERKSMVMSEEEKRMTAYHEGGHAIVSLHCPASDPIHKATIIPRGRALGMVMRLPEGDKLSYHRDKMHDDLAVAMGGRVAEELIFGYDKVSSGASSDIKYATRLARAMVSEWGMSDALGPILYGSDQESGYLGGGGGRGSVSEGTQELVDAEVKRLVQEANDRAKNILIEHREELERLALALLEYETLNGDEIKQVIAGGQPNRESSSRPAVRKMRSAFPRGSTKADEQNIKGDVDVLDREE